MTESSALGAVLTLISIALLLTLFVFQVAAALAGARERAAPFCKHVPRAPADASPRSRPAYAHRRGPQVRVARERLCRLSLFALVHPWRRRSEDGMFQVNFKITLPELSCEVNCPVKHCTHLSRVR